MRKSKDKSSEKERKVPQARTQNICKSEFKHVHERPKLELKDIQKRAQARQVEAQVVESRPSLHSEMQKGSSSTARQVSRASQARTERYSKARSRAARQIASHEKLNKPELNTAKVQQGKAKEQKDICKQKQAIFKGKFENMIDVLQY